MIAVRRRPKPEVFAVMYNEDNSSSVSGVWGTIARRNIV
jgi:hypothetical protein